LSNLAQEERLFNPNCLCIVLLNHIRKTCGYGDQNPPIIVDLASETGEVMDLVNKPKELAKKYLEPRGTYILLKVVGGSMHCATLESFENLTCLSQ
jgi:hypothetical protein